MSGAQLMTAFAMLSAVAESFDLSVGDLLGRNRRVRFVQARHSAMAIIRDQLKLSHPAVGEIFGRDHATSIHACKNVRNWLDVDADFRGKFRVVLAAAIGARQEAANEFNGEGVA